MKKQKMWSVKDNTDFKRSEKSRVTYRMQRKEKPGYCVFTSNTSGLSFRVWGKNVEVYVNK